MDFKTYQQEAARTCPSLGDKKLDLCHMVLGINTEINELDVAFSKKDNINIVEEAIDVHWYVANYMRLRSDKMKASYEELCTESLETLSPSNFVTRNTTRYFKDETLDIVTGLYNSTSSLQDLIKKHIAYNKEIKLIDEEVLLEIIIYKCFCAVLYAEQKIEKALQNNIDKLRKRFPDKFNEEQAINRDLEAERKELEK